MPITVTRDAPRKPAAASGRWLAMALALLVNVAFIGVLFFSIRWQNRQPQPVVAELYAPPSRTPPVEVSPPPPQPVPVPPPVPQPVPEPVPPPQPVPQPAPPVKAVPQPEPPDT